MKWPPPSGNSPAKVIRIAAKGRCTSASLSFPSTDKLSHNDFSAIRAGARVDVDTYDKADARDFVLWKAPKNGEPFWETPIGPGRPGWHIECSVMAIRYLGETLDIHAGGVDLIFPHHENEIAQSVSLTGKPFARYWLHSEFLLVDGQKMSKSLGNFYTLRDVLARGYPPEAVRYLLASVPHRKQLNFTFEGLKSAETAVDRLRNFKLRLEKEKFPPGTNEKIAVRTAEAETQFSESLDADLNTAEALAAVFEYLRDANIAMDAGDFCDANAAAARSFLDRFDSDIRRACGPPRSTVRSQMPKWRPGLPRARRRRRPVISLKPTAFATNCWRKASFSKTPRTEFDGKESKAAYQGRARGRSQTGRQPRPGHHPHQHGGELSSTKTWSSSTACSGARNRASATHAMTILPTGARRVVCRVRKRSRRAGVQLRDGRNLRGSAHCAD